MVQELSCGSWPDFSSVSGGTSKSGRIIRHVTSFGETEVCWNCIPVIISWILWRCFVYLFLCPLLWLHKWLKIWQNSHKEEEVENSELKKHKKKKKKKEKKKKGKQKVVCCWWIWFIRFVYLLNFFSCNVIWFIHFNFSCFLFCCRQWRTLDMLQWKGPKRNSNCDMIKL